MAGNLNNLNFFLALAAVCWLLACDASEIQQQGKEIEVAQPEMETLVAQKVRADDFHSLSLFSLLQANGSGLFITPGSGHSNGRLFRLPALSDISCCTEYEKILGTGRGPDEMQQVTASSESFNSDTLLFYSSPDQKLLAYDSEMNKMNISDQIPRGMPLNRGFTYSNGYLMMPSEPQLTGGESLLTIFNVMTQTSINALPLRVPLQMEPAIRNLIFSSASLPDGFAVSFIGDREIYLLDFRGNVTGRLKLGNSDPIGEPFRISNPALAPSAKPYIPKMEFQSGKLFVLMDSILWILEYESRKAEHRLRILDDASAVEPRVLDFSVTDEMLYLRLAPNEIYMTPVRPYWLE